MGLKIAEGKYGLKRKGGKTPNLYLWRNDPKPMLEEENVSEIPTILQMAEASPAPKDIETIIQGIVAIPTTNQPMDDEEPLQYFTLIVRTNLTTQVNMATVGDGPDDDKEEQVKTSKGGLKGSPPCQIQWRQENSQTIYEQLQGVQIPEQKERNHESSGQLGGPRPHLHQRGTGPRLGQRHHGPDGRTTGKQAKPNGRNK